MLRSLVCLTFLGFIGGGLGCASSIKPKELPSSAVPSEEISKQDDALRRADRAGIASTSPRSFNNAKRSLDRARRLQANNSEPSKTLEAVGMSMAWLERGERNSKQFNELYADILEVRNEAIAEDAPSKARKTWKSAQNRFEDFVEDFEKGDREELTVGQRRRLQDGFIEAHIAALRENNLRRSFDNLARAREKDALDYIPNIYREAQRRVMEAEGVIRANRHDPERIKTASAEAERITDRTLELLDRARRVDRSSPEKVALEIDKIETLNSSLKTRLAASSTAMQENNQAWQNRLQGASAQAALQEKLTEVETMFGAEEAQVFRRADSVILRLKGLDFRVGDYEIPNRNFPLVTKVREVLSELPVQKVVIEGHTDSTGSEKVNMELSKRRAEAVKNFLVAEGQLSPNIIEIVAMGETQPIASNNNKAGRAANRRVDVVVNVTTPDAQPEVETGVKSVR